MSIPDAILGYLSILVRSSPYFVGQVLRATTEAGRALGNDWGLLVVVGLMFLGIINLVSLLWWLLRHGWRLFALGAALGFGSLAVTHWRIL